jgi:hypothetical protein
LPYLPDSQIGIRRHSHFPPRSSGIQHRAAAIPHSALLSPFAQLPPAKKSFHPRGLLLSTCFSGSVAKNSRVAEKDIWTSV